MSLFPHLSQSRKTVDQTTTDSSDLALESFDISTTELDNQITEEANPEQELEDILSQTEADLTNTATEDLTTEVTTQEEDPSQVVEETPIQTEETVVQEETPIAQTDTTEQDGGTTVIEQEVVTDPVVQEENSLQVDQTEEQKKPTNDIDGTGENLAAPSEPVQEDEAVVQTEQSDITQVEEQAASDPTQTEESVVQEEEQKTSTQDEDGVTQTVTEEAPISTEQTEDNTVVDQTNTQEPVQEESVVVEQTADTPTQTIPYREVSGLESLVQYGHEVVLGVHSLYDKLEQKILVNALSNVAREYSLSAPLVAVMKAIPNLSTALESFPDTSLFNILPETKQSHRQLMGLESLGATCTAIGDDSQAKMWNVIDKFSKVVYELNDKLPILIQRVDNAKADLNSTEIPEEVMAVLPVTTLSDEAFNEALTMVEEYLGKVGVFDASDLRAHPEKLKEQIDELVDMTGDMGRILGIAMDNDALVASDKGPDFVATQGTFSEKNISKSSIQFYLDKISSMLQDMSLIVEKRNDIVDALQSESKDLPDQDGSDEAVYGCDAHLKLMGCYVMLVSKLIEETMVLVSRVTGLVDTVVSNATTNNE